MSAGRKMRAWRLPAGCTSVEQLELVELPRPDPAPGEVLVRVHATSLNYRDQAIAQGRYLDRKSTRLNSSHSQISYAVFCLKKKKDLYTLYRSTHASHLRIT